MNVLSALVLVSTVLAASPNPAGGDVAAAQKRLEAARGALAKAVQRIEKDPPSTADLDAAHAAVGVLKDAIDAGAEFEAKDLDYAKSVLAARKELRTQREYVDQRRANVHIHNHRRTIDAAIATMNDRAKRTENKDATPKDFEDARAATAATKKALDEARQFAKQDAKFGSYVEETDAAIARQEKAVDDRWALRESGKHRAVIEESSMALTAAMSELSKNGTDAQFEAADRAANVLSKQLDEGKVFESRDKNYRADAERSRTQLAQAKKRMEELLSASALERLKSEIEPAHKDLLAALKVIRGKRPTPEQLAEAKTATIVVGKLVEKFQPQAARSPAFGQYVTEVKKTLVEAEIDLQRRSVDAARHDVVQALRNVERRNATDENFAELNTSLTVLEKTLEGVHKGDAELNKVVADAKTQMRDARTTMTKRRGEVDLQNQRAKVQEARKTAEAAVRQIQQANVAPPQLQEAETAVKQLGTTLEDGKAFVKKDSDYAKYDREIRERIADLNGRIAARRIALAATGGRTQLTEAINEAKAAVEAAKAPDSGDAEITVATKNLDTLMQVIETNAALEKQDKGYAASAERARGEVLRQTEALENAKLARAVRRQTGEALAAGTAAANAAASEKNLHKQKDHYVKALAQFRACEKEGAKMLQENPALTKATVLVESAPMTPKEVIALCAEQAKAAEAPLRQASALVAFEDGPKRSFEAGKGLLAANKKNESLPQFEECIASAKMVRYDYPELKDRKFTVAGSNVTIAELIDQCVQHRKSVMAQK